LLVVDAIICVHTYDCINYKQRAISPESLMRDSKGETERACDAMGGVNTHTRVRPPFDRGGRSATRVNAAHEQGNASRGAKMRKLARSRARIACGWQCRKCKEARAARGHFTPVENPSVVGVPTWSNHIVGVRIERERKAPGG